MKHASRILACIVCVLLTGLALAGGTTASLVTATGTIAKVGADSLTIRPREPDGKFGKALTLKITGTSKISIATQQKRAGKLVFVQRETDAKDLAPKQPIAVIFSTGAKGSVLLSAVVLPVTK